RASDPARVPDDPRVDAAHERGERRLQVRPGNSKRPPDRLVHTTSSRRLEGPGDPSAAAELPAAAAVGSRSDRSGRFAQRAWPFIPEWPAYGARVTDRAPRSALGLTLPVGAIRVDVVDLRERHEWSPRGLLDRLGSTHQP